MAEILQDFHIRIWLRPTAAPGAEDDLGLTPNSFSPILVFTEKGVPFTALEGSVPSCLVSFVTVFGNWSFSGICE
jgi:hypothetical protein